MKAQIYPVKISYIDGSTQVINPSEKFDGKYKELCQTIAEGRKHEYKILKGFEDKPRNRR